MAKPKRDDLSPLRLAQLGKVYCLIEQFDEISRIELSKLSGFAPATITATTRDLIEHQFIIEKSARSTDNRGRPATALCVSPDHWQLLCASLSDSEFWINLIRLDGELLQQKCYSFTNQNFAQFLIESWQQFCAEVPFFGQLLMFSITVNGQLDDNQHLLKLGKYQFDKFDLAALFKPYVNSPILLAEQFKTWLLVESTLGNAISRDDVLFIQIDEEIQLQVLEQGELLCEQPHFRMDANKLLVPQQHSLQSQINLHLPAEQRAQLQHQVNDTALAQYVDLCYPTQKFASREAKLNFLCQRIRQQDKSAVEILKVFCDALTYALMNLVNLFGSQRILLNCRLLELKEPLLDLLNQQLTQKLADKIIDCEVFAGKYGWNSVEVASSAIKQQIYRGNLLAHIIKME